jgi:sugar (pentulose or hexulose) kinase
VSGSPSARLHLGSDSRLALPGEGDEALTIQVPRTGATLRWFTDHFADSDQSIAVVENATVFEVIDEKASGIPPGCEGLICLMPGPEKGEGTGAGGLVGLTESHGRYHVFRAILEGAAFALRGAVEAAGGRLQDLEVIEVEGAGARSRLWLQIHADVLRTAIRGEREAKPDPARRPTYEAAYARYLHLRKALEA